MKIYYLLIQFICWMFSHTRITLCTATPYTNVLPKPEYFSEMLFYTVGSMITYSRSRSMVYSWLLLKTAQNNIGKKLTTRDVHLTLLRLLWHITFSFWELSLQHKTHTNTISEDSLQHKAHTNTVSEDSLQHKTHKHCQWRQFTE